MASSSGSAGCRDKAAPTDKTNELQRTRISNRTNELAASWAPAPVVHAGKSWQALAAHPPPRSNSATMG
jgi:hypothetical protein